MNEIINLMNQNENLMLFGVLLNLMSTIGFGIYKSFNLNSEQMEYLMEKYPVRNSAIKLAIYWFVPYLGYFLVFKDILLLQKYIRHEYSVFDYIEDKLKKEVYSYNKNERNDDAN